MDTNLSFLESDFITTHIKEKLSASFQGPFLYKILDEAPDELLKINGIGAKKRDQILKSWAAFKAKESLTQFLEKKDLPKNWSEILWEAYKDEAILNFKKNPYQISIDYKFPFDDLDTFALKEGFSPTCADRVRAATYDFLEIQARQGHCAYPEQELLRLLTEKLNVSAEVLEEVLESEFLSEHLVIDLIRGTPCVYLKKIWLLEKEVAHKLLDFKNREVPCGWINFPKAINWAERLLGLSLEPLQKKAIETALCAPLTIITGGPGTGKTTLIRSLTTILKTQFIKFSLCAPTGRAAQRLEETTGCFAQTIHRLLKFDGVTGQFAYNEKNKLDVDVLLIDEASMLDLELMAYVLRALPGHCGLVLVGDADQIPSVGAGSVFQSVIMSAQFPVVQLQNIFRQSEKSLIKMNAFRVNKGMMPLSGEGGGDFHYIPVQNFTEAKEKVLTLLLRQLPPHYSTQDLEQVQVLAPLNRGVLGTEALNEALQNTLNPTSAVVTESLKFRVKDKVMVTKNDYKKNVFNGDIGFIENIDPVGQSVDIRFGQRHFTFSFKELENLTLAYSISVHKSQGSEYKTVIVVISKEHASVAQRHLVYTAMTRGKENVFLVAEADALETAVKRDENSGRWQRLSELLKVEGEKSGAFSGDATSSFYI